MVRLIGVLLAGTATIAAGAASAGDMDGFRLRGSTAYGEAPRSYPMRATIGRDDANGMSYPVNEAPAPAPDAIASPAPELIPEPAAIPRAFEFEVGARYWYSSGKIAKSLFDVPGGGQSLLSRLSYRGLSSHSGEVFARADNSTGIFVKGYAGLGNFAKGSLNDEDFPPGIDPYSSTLSDQRNGRLSYLSADLGYGIVTAPNYRVGAFVGYHYLAEQVNAFGCSQIAANPFVCAPAIDGSVLGISEDAKWSSARLGLSADVKITDRLTFAVDAAWIPYAKLTAADTHWLRLGTSFSGPIPESGTGSGAQFEASLSYQFTKAFAVGVGARYWHLETRGSADFGAVAAGALPQPINFVSERAGAYVQGAYRFGVM